MDGRRYRCVCLISVPIPYVLTCYMVVSVSCHYVCMYVQMCLCVYMRELLLYGVIVSMCCVSLWVILVVLFCCWWLPSVLFCFLVLCSCGVLFELFVCCGAVYIESHHISRCVICGDFVVIDRV